ncbi:hypothetical protein ZHAS_00006654 [Anopheles sinensis]|uniref:Uncharacterized protein n=1 Tax=Anopheles sinensis TaxID=74873 RepID=A0A084VMV6_ANOSI|nr:hypothetical protein ZHAS_00006654 [Anopheles sinensis]
MTIARPAAVCRSNRRGHRVPGVAVGVDVDVVIACNMRTPFRIDALKNWSARMLGPLATELIIPVRDRERPNEEGTRHKVQESSTFDASYDQVLGRIKLFITEISTSIRTPNPLSPIPLQEFIDGDELTIRNKLLWAKSYGIIGNFIHFQEWLQRSNSQNSQLLPGDKYVHLLYLEPSIDPVQMAGN